MQKLQNLLKYLKQQTATFDNTEFTLTATITYCQQQISIKSKSENSRHFQHLYKKNARSTELVQSTQVKLPNLQTFLFFAIKHAQTGILSKTSLFYRTPILYTILELLPHRSRRISGPTARRNRHTWRKRTCPT